jgi:hypothetical protein
MEALWTANIHDCIDGKVWPVMGAGYHTIHHTSGLTASFSFLCLPERNVALLPTDWHRRCRICDEKTRLAAAGPYPFLFLLQNN